MNSLRRTLMIWLTIGISSGILIAGILIYQQAEEEANQVFDYQMKQLVASLPAQAFSPLAPQHDNGAVDEQDVIIQIWGSNGLRIYRSHEHTALPQRAELGFADISAQGTRWRVYSAQIGNTIVQVAQPLSARRQLAARMALKTTAPLLIILPFLALLIWLTVGQGLLSVKRVAKEVQSRDMAALTPISDLGVPQEIKPLTSALNDLLKRLEFSIDAQRTFVADAAHELKTPLAALKLQIQLAERASNESDRQAAFADVRQGLERATHLVHQLLTLARQEPGAVEQVYEHIELADLARSVVADFAMLANSKRIDLGISNASTGLIHGNRDAVRTLLGNLIDNAIRYSPNGARVDVAVERADQTMRLIVDDTGPGIPEADINRVLDRFYRVPGTSGSGSGLGLAIVAQIASMHNARVTLENRAHGLSVAVKFGLAVAKKN